MTLFEVFAREWFTAHVPDYESIVRRHRRGVFQRLDDGDRLFAEYIGVPISALVPEGTWSQLQVVFQQRHLFVHRQGVIDEQYLQLVNGSRQGPGQRLVLDRRDAQEAFEALEVVVRAVSAES